MVGFMMIALNMAIPWAFQAISFTRYQTQAEEQRNNLFQFANFNSNFNMELKGIQSVA